MRWRQRLGSMAGRDVLRGRRWRHVGAGTGPAHGVSGGARRLGGPRHGVRDARRGCGMRAGQRHARPARRQWLGSAARSAKTVAMRGPEECSRWPVCGSALKAAGPCVGPCEALRPDSGSCVGPVLVRRGVILAGEQRRVSPEPEKTVCFAETVDNGMCCWQRRSDGMCHRRGRRRTQRRGGTMQGLPCQA